MFKLFSHNFIVLIAMGTLASGVAFPAYVEARGARWQSYNNASAKNRVRNKVSRTGINKAKRDFNDHRYNTGRHPWKGRRAIHRLLPSKVLKRFKPEIARILRKLAKSGKTGTATLDGDGTLWSGDVGEGFFLYMVRNRHYPARRLPFLRNAWKDYKNGTFDGERFYELMVTSMAGMKESKVKELASKYFDSKEKSKIYKPMVNLIKSITKIGITPWVVSGSPYWVVAAGAKHMGIPRNQVIGLSVKVDENGRLTDEVVRPVPWKAGKARRIIQDVGRLPIFAAGNSLGDIQMLRIASEIPLVINPSPGVAKQARDNGWTVHRYTRKDHVSARENN